MLSNKWCFRALAALLLGSVFCFAEVRRYEGPGPVEIHVRANAKTGMDSNLETVFKTQFYPAISAQTGFRHCDLLRSPEHKGAYILTIAFDSEDLRVSWANSDLHQRLWPKMQANFDAETMKIEAFGMVATQSK
jgi:heme-degrading monooxygenase HmoA